MLLDKLGKELLFFDGGMGTLLQEAGLRPGELPENWNVEKSNIIQEIHKAYWNAGSRILLTNTFGANGIKYTDQLYSIQEVVNAAVANARSASKDAYIALDVGPTGKLLKPMGDLAFEDAYSAFRELIVSGVNAGVDLIHIETMSDTYELKAAVLAAKENSNLPVFATVIFDEKGKLLTGADVPSVVALLEGLRVDALGINCGMGPKQMLPILQEIRKYTSLPIIVKPNAGLPKQKEGKTIYDVAPDVFAEELVQLVKTGACLIGGCCGTTPKHIEAMCDACFGMSVVSPEKKQRTLISSYGACVEISDRPIIIGERMNPTGKKMLQKALVKHDMDYLLKEAIGQQEKGAHVLDVNVGLPEVDEVQLMKDAIYSIQSVCLLPLQIDSPKVEVLEAAMRIYNGKPMINSVTGEWESMEAVFPLVQKYGGVVVGLTIDENGIPKTAGERLAIAEKIVGAAKKYGIEKKDIVIDVLTLTASAEPNVAKVTLDALKLVRSALGVRTVLGVSNISFGLPNRAIINSYFYEMALQNGLSAGIINPLSDKMMQAYYSYCALMGYDENFKKYIDMQEMNDVTAGILCSEPDGLRNAIVHGLKEDARQHTYHLLEDMKPLDIIQNELVPALDEVGKGYEQGTVFLPNLLMSAEAAKAAFEILKDKMSGSSLDVERKEKIILATVKGDIHDIGKNIVKVLLENYGFEIIDLGKDVAPQRVVEAVKMHDAKLVGLSALMTTTVESMKETISLLKKAVPECIVMVGGAVLNPDYAELIRADFYGKDAMQSVHYAKKILKNESESEG